MTNGGVRLNRAYHKAYQQNGVNTATPERLVLMLYDGAVSFLLKAERAMEEGLVEEVNRYLLRAQDIVSELTCCLDFKCGEEVAENLYRIYEYVNHRLVQANIRKDPEMTEEVRRLLSELRDAWEEAVIKARDGNGGRVRVAL